MQRKIGEDIIEKRCGQGLAEGKVEGESIEVLRAPSWVDKEEI